MEFSPQKIVRENVSDVVFSELKKNIANGNWRAGEKLPSENEIAEAFGVSRVTVRAALNRLAALNLVVTRNGGGTYVNKFRFSDLMDEISGVMAQQVSYEEVSRFRAMLEEYSARQAAACSHDEGALDKLERHLQAMEAACREKDLQAFFDADYHFHREICKLAGNQMLVYAYTMMNSVATFYWSQHVTAENGIRNGLQGVDYWLNAIDCHRSLYDAVRRGDGDAAAEILDQMILGRPSA